MFLYRLPPLRVGRRRVTRWPLAGGGGFADEPIVNTLPPPVLVGVDGVKLGAGLDPPPPNENPVPDAGSPELLVAGEAG